jgi:hypothetical protein
MRQLFVAAIGLLAVSALLIEGDVLNGSQAPRLEPTEPPGIQINPEQTPPVTPPQSPSPGFGGFRRGLPPRFVPGQGPTSMPRAVHMAPSGAPARPLQSTLLIPAGLSMPAEDLFLDLGYDPVICIPLTPTTSFDIAYKCYARGLYSDAIAFARHGLTMCNDARLYLLKGDCELHLGRGADAERTASDFRAALAQQQLFGIEAARERINDAMAVRFDDIAGYQATGS